MPCRSPFSAGLENIEGGLGCSIGLRFASLAEDGGAYAPVADEFRSADGCTAVPIRTALGCLARRFGGQDGGRS